MLDMLTVQCILQSNPVSPNKLKNNNNIAKLQKYKRSSFLFLTFVKNPENEDRNIKRRKNTS